MSVRVAEIIRQILTIYRNYDYQSHVLVASVRHPQHVVEAALAGGHICTMPLQCVSAIGQTSAHGYRTEEVFGRLESARHELAPQYRSISIR
jgi:transaldolase